jgi:hypothetical protein
MNRILALLLLAVPLLFASCAKEPLKQAGIQGEATLEAVRGLTSAYEHRDLEGFLDRVSPAYDGRETLRKEVEKVFAAYQNIGFTVQTRKMLFTVEHNGNIRATFTWEGEWRTTGGRIVKDGARVTFVLDAGTYKLLYIDGKNPFVLSTTPMPARQ